MTHPHRIRKSRFQYRGESPVVLAPFVALASLSGLAYGAELLIAITGRRRDQGEFRRVAKMESVSCPTGSTATVPEGPEGITRAATWLDMHPEYDVVLEAFADDISDRARILIAHSG